MAEPEFLLLHHSIWIRSTSVKLIGKGAYHES